MPSEKSATKNRTILDARRDPKLDAANSKPKSGESPIPTNRRLSPLPVSLSTRMTELAVARLGTIVRLGEALPVVFFSSAVDFILPVNCRRSTTAVRAASGTAGKMNSLRWAAGLDPSVSVRAAQLQLDNPRRLYTRVLTTAKIRSMARTSHCPKTPNEASHSICTSTYHSPISSSPTS